jgi:hypothetical protein
MRKEITGTLEEIGNWPPMALIRLGEYTTVKVACTPAQAKELGSRLYRLVTLEIEVQAGYEICVLENFIGSQG